MTGSSDIRPQRLPPAALQENFTDLHGPLDRQAARLAAERCLFCYDAPCIAACPTAIDIPLFVRQIAADRPLAAAKTILDANIFGGMCARVCPTETLCEDACVRRDGEGGPVAIGHLQRHATDTQFASGRQLYRAGVPSGRKVAVVGAGPAGLACAHKLATLGHAVTVYEGRAKSGGLNEHGIAAYKTVDDFAQLETAWILDVGGIELKAGHLLGRDFDLADLRRDYDAIFLGLGLQSVNALGLGEGPAGVEDAVAFIERLRQTDDLSTLAIGRRVVVIGGGMTAIDAAVQARKLGADEVTIVYRRGPEQMGASVWEQDLARTEGVVIRQHARPMAFRAEAAVLRAVVFSNVVESEGVLRDTGETFELAADQLFTAIGQMFLAAPLGEGSLLDMENGRIAVDPQRRTSVPGVWAGGDCIAGGQDLTVVAVEDGKTAALSIDRMFRGVAAKV